MTRNAAARAATEPGEQTAWERLARELGPIREALEQLARAASNMVRSPAGSIARVTPSDAGPEDPTSLPLDELQRLFGLSDFERSLLLFCAGAEFDPRIAPLCAAAHGDSRSTQPTFFLAAQVVDGAHWSALSPAGPLRHWRMIECTSDRPLATTPLRVDERILYFLAGVQHMDDRLAGLVAPVREAAEPAPSQEQVAEQIAEVWSRRGAASLIQLCGEDHAGKRAIVCRACALTGLAACEMQSAVLPAHPAETDALLRLWEREALLSGLVLLLDDDSAPNAAGSQEAALHRLLERICVPAVLGTRTQRPLGDRCIVIFDVNRPRPQEQKALWVAALQSSPGGERCAATLAAQFDLGAAAIRSACALVDGKQAADEQARAAQLWDACRALTRPRLDDLAQRIETRADWNLLVLPPGQLALLREILVHVRHRARVYNDWGFAAQSTRGLGISALFYGPSGTGKTLAAEVLAGALRLDLYRIDLSQVVSKYIGETEKNLRRVFDAAEGGGAVLLFDEADTLFGKRSQVKDSHDRYANIEVGYLLQRMEAYRGLAILTTNLKEALDSAFLRRIRFVVEFPFPDLALRTQIWERILPPGTPRRNLRPERLARLNVPGGNIRNIAMGAAFLAAEEDSPVEMRHLLKSARSEYRKIERILTDAEVEGWV